MAPVAVVPTGLRRPLPPAGALWSVHGVSRNDVTAVGDGGRIVHWDGRAWTATTAGSANLRRVLMLGPGEGWIAESFGALRHAVGGVWTTTSTNVGLGPSQFWASSPRDIWIAGAGGYHFDGNAWARLSAAGNPIENVWGSGPDDVYLAGSSTSFFH